MSPGDGTSGRIDRRRRRGRARPAPPDPSSSSNPVARDQGSDTRGRRCRAGRRPAGRGPDASTRRRDLAVRLPDVTGAAGRGLDAIGTRGRTGTRRSAAPPGNAPAEVHQRLVPAAGVGRIDQRSPPRPPTDRRRGSSPNPTRATIRRTFTSSAANGRACRDRRDRRRRVRADAGKRRSAAGSVGTRAAVVCHHGLCGPMQRHGAPVVARAPPMHAARPPGCPRERRHCREPPKERTERGLDVSIPSTAIAGRTAGTTTTRRCGSPGAVDVAGLEQLVGHPGCEYWRMKKTPKAVTSVGQDHRLSWPPDPAAPSSCTGG